MAARFDAVGMRLRQAIQREILQWVRAHSPDDRMALEDAFTEALKAISQADVRKFVQEAMREY